MAESSEEFENNVCPSRVKYRVPLMGRMTSPDTHRSQLERPVPHDSGQRVLKKLNILLSELEG